MSIQVAWDSDDYTVLRYIFYGWWSWQDLDDAVAIAEPMIRSVPHPVHVLIDLRESCDVPNLDTMEDTRAMSMAPGTSSYLILTGEIWMTRKFYELSKRLYRSRRPRNLIAYSEVIHQARDIIVKVLRQTA